jgi:O-antigen/teichoic acid export membrane protein
MNLSKKDVVWGYFAQFFTIASGILILPLVLRLLTPEEIGMNFLMLTIGTMVSLLDFGFAPQIGRNFSYVFAGAQILQKEGLGISNEVNATVNYRLLATLIHTAKFIYRIISFVVLFVMLSFGTLYIYIITKGFTNVDNALIIWCLYSVSTFFNIYYAYYISMLSGKGMIKEMQKSIVYSRIAYIMISVVLLLFDFGLIGVVLANFIAPFVSRYLSYHYFYSLDIKEKINNFIIDKSEILDLFTIIWYNAKKLGIVYIGAYAITKFGIFLSGLYLSLPEVASYGIMMQLVGVISTVAGTLFTISNPRFSILKFERNNTLLLKNFALSMGVFYLVFIIGGFILAFIGPLLFSALKSNIALPATYIILLYVGVMMLEANHSYFSTIIVIGNSVPFVWISLMTGGLIILGSFISLYYTNLGILGLVLVQGGVQGAYNNWKWPKVVCKDFNISFFDFLKLSMFETATKLKIHKK